MKEIRLMKNQARRFVGFDRFRIRWRFARSRIRRRSKTTVQDEEPSFGEESTKMICYFWPRDRQREFVWHRIRRRAFVWWRINQDDLFHLINRQTMRIWSRIRQRSFTCSRIMRGRFGCSKVRRRRFLWSRISRRTCLKNQPRRLVRLGISWRRLFRNRMKMVSSIASVHLALPRPPWALIFCHVNILILEGPCLFWEAPKPISRQKWRIPNHSFQFLLI